MRKALLPLIIIIATSLLLIRIFYLQVVNDTFKLQSENNAIKIKYDYPERGYIYDRYGKLLVANQPSYDIMVIPRELKKIDTAEFCLLLNITKEFFDERMAKAKIYSPRLPSVFLPQLNKLEYAAFQEKIRKFEGFYIQKRSLRDYQITAGANVFGFITQVSEREIAKNPYYNSGDLIGKQGVEESYEKILRGIKGVKYIQKDKPVFFSGKWGTSTTSISGVCFFKASSANFKFFTISPYKEMLICISMSDLFCSTLADWCNGLIL